MALMPKESAKVIARLSKNVFIEEEGVKNLACAVNKFSIFLKFTIYFEVLFFAYKFNALLLETVK